MAAAAAAVAPAVETAGSDDETSIAPQLPWMLRLKYGAIAFAIQKLVVGPVSLLQQLQDLLPFLSSSSARRDHPNIIKSYPARRSLSVR